MIDSSKFQNQYLLSDWEAEQLIGYFKNNYQWK